jgi:hypothetical protein
MDIIPTNKEKRTLLFTRMKKFFASNYAAYKIRAAYKSNKLKFNASKIAFETEDNYKKMMDVLNKGGNHDYLDEIVNGGMKVEFEEQLRKFKHLGKLSWRT